MIEEAVYPCLGPGRTVHDVENARSALEKAYQAKGYQTVAVQVPPQQVAGGVVVLQVVESNAGSDQRSFDGHPGVGGRLSTSIP
jgi:hemolysin activation/secretion protein